MTGGVRAIVIFGDVVASRRDSRASTAWLRTLTTEFDAACPPGHVLAPFGFTQGDELQGLLSIEADPFAIVVRAALHPKARPMRWAVAAGRVEPGDGPATQRSGEAFVLARELLEVGRRRRDDLLVRLGDASADALMADLSPLLADLLAELTDRQREVARLMLVEGLRRADVADRLEVSRATVSVMAERARIRRIEGLLGAVRRITADGLEASA